MIKRPRRDISNRLLCTLSAALAASMVACAARAESAATSLPTWRDLPYATVSPAQKLDIYLPESAAPGDGPYPVIVAIHGGAFLAGDKSGGQLPAVLAARDRGYAVVSVNYRLSGEAKWPACVHDVKAAIRWIRGSASTYRFDPDRVATWGSSAGGYLAAIVGTSADVAELEGESLGHADQSSRVQVVVDWFGPINFLTMDSQFAARGVNGMRHNTSDSPESQLLGVPITDAPELVRAADPAAYITADDPPFFIQHGTVDPLIPVEQSVEFARALTGVLGDDDVVFEPLTGAGHGGRQFRTPANVARVLDFLDARLKPAAAPAKSRR